MAFESRDVFNGKLIEKFNNHTNKEVGDKVQQAEKAFRTWKHSTMAVRAIHMLSLADLLRERSDELAKIISQEMGKHIKESKAEIEKCAYCCDYYAENADIFLKRERLVVSEGRAYTELNPLGVILGVMPWNFPFWQVFRFAVPTIMAGNSCLLKHAPNVPRCAQMIEKLFNETGFPNGVMQNLYIDEHEVSQIIQDKRIQGVSLTGSTKAGGIVASKAAAQIKKSVLELGGSDPFIVLNDANLEEAASVAAQSRMINNGQSCIAAKRIIVEDAVFVKFLDHFINAMQAFKIGDPFDESNDLGCMARKDLIDNLHRQVSKSLEMGARKLIGAEIDEKHPLIYKPTILMDVQDGMPAFDQELFGPVAVMYRVDNAEEAVEVANASPYGLGASLWTNNLSKAEELASEIESGSVYINRMMASHPAVPFGGVKQSGFGRELSEYGILEFVNRKTIWRN